MHPKTREKLIVTVVGWVVAFLIFFPILWMILTSFKTELEAFSTPPKFLFFDWTTENYAAVEARSDYFHFAANSILLSVGSTLVALLFAVPFVDRSGQRSPLRRPVACLAVIFVFLVLGSLAYLGETSPWSPEMDAWSGLPLPESAVAGRSPLQLVGAAVFQNKQCRNCHAVGGTGGARGPALDDVAARLSGDQLIRQVLQGGGNMPAYAKQLTPPEVTALVAWMTTLHPAFEPPAHEKTWRRKKP